MKPKFTSRLFVGLSSIALALSAPSAFGATETFNTAGTFNWVCPGGVTSIQVECWGGGGAGGAGRKDADINTNSQQNGGGGGGGAYARRVAVPVTPGLTYSVTIPAAAVSGSAGTTTNGQGRVNGGSVTFVGNSSVTVTAAGGTGGANAYVSGSNTVVTAAGGAGGTTAASVGDVGALFAGGAGPTSTSGTSGASGSGGGGGGSTAAGGAGTATTASVSSATPVALAGGTGGSTGGGNGGSGFGAGSVAGNASAGGSGAVAGGGGGGGHNVGQNTRLGGNGGLGQVALSYTVPPNFKADNTDDLNLASSWTGGFVPTGSIAEWKTGVTGANTTSLGGDLTFSGIKISDPGGLVTVNSPGGFTLTLGAAAVDLDLSTATQDLTLNSKLALGAANVWNVASGRTLTLGGEVSGTSTVTKQGSGTATLSGASTYSGTTTVSGGSLNVNGSLVNASLGNLIVQAGGTLNASGTLTGSTTTALTYGSTAGTSSVNVSSGANLTLGALTGSNNASAVSIYNQTGGTVNLNAAATTTDTSYVAQLGYGYMNLSGGSIASNSRYSVTFSSAGASGVARIGGGVGAATLSANDLLAVGRTSSATGEMTVLSNGTVTYNGTGANNMLLLGNAANPTGFLNIVGGTFSSPVKGISWGNGTTANGGLGMVNLGSGTLEIGANTVLNTIVSGGTNRGHINFAGGTMKLRASGLTAPFLPASNGGFASLSNTIFGPLSNSTANLDGTGAPSGIAGQDFTGGLTVDTNGFASTTISGSLVAPAAFGVGQGNLSITGGSGYLAPPTVKFSNPAAANNTPAAGYALVSGGLVTGIVITCPGNYASGETPTVTLGGGGGTGASVTVTGTLAANTSGGLTKSGGGTLTLTGANTYTGATVVNAGQLTLSGSGTIAAASGLSVAGSAAFRYLPTTVGSTLTVSSLSLANGSTLGLAWDTTTANQIAATGAATVGSGTGVALDMGSGYTPGTSYTVLTAASGLDVGNYTFLNLTDFTMSVVKTPTSVSVTPTTTTPLTGTYWRGTATAGLTKIWAATDGNTDSNWSATDGGATQGLVPGAGADVFIPSTLPVVPATSTVLGANMAIKTLTIADTTNGMSLNADGSTLTITPGAATSGILVNASVPASSIATNVALGADQTWTNNSSNDLTVSGSVSGGFALNKAGSGTLILPVANSFSGGLTMKRGTVTLGAATSAGTGTLSFDNGGLGSATVNFTRATALTATNPVNVLAGSASSNTIANVGSSNVTLNSAIDIASGTTLTLANNNVGTSSLELGGTALVTGLGAVTTSGTSTGNLVFRGANTYSGGTTLGGSSVHVPATSTTGPAGSPTDGNFGPGILNIGTISMRSTTTADTTIGNTLVLAGDLTAINGGASEKTLTFSGPATLTGSRTITSNVSASGKSLTFSGNIDDGGNGYGLSKDGTGKLVLSGTASTFTGPVVVSTGILQSFGAGTLANIGTASALGSGNATSNATNAASLVLDGGTYSITNTNAPVTTDRLFTLTQNGGTLSADNGTAAYVITFGNTAPIAYSGIGVRTLTLGGAHPGGTDANIFAPQITDAGSDVVSLQKSGTTNWALTNTNTYTGATTINAGTLQLGDGTSGNDGTIANTSGVTNNATLAFNRFGSSTAGYAISGTGAVSKLGVGTQTLSGLSATAASNYTGTTTIDEGTLAFTTTNPSLTGGLTFGVSAGSTTTGALDLSAASATFAGTTTVQTNSANANTITVGSGKTLTFTGTAFNVGTNATPGYTTKLTIAGASSGVGSLVFDNASTALQVGVAPAADAAATTVTMDLSTLASASMGTIANPITSLKVGGRTTGGILTLSDTANVITATTLDLGNSNGGNPGSPNTMTLGTGTNVLNVDTINIGFSKATATLKFTLQTTGSPGTVTILNKAGATGLAALNIGSQNGTGTGTGLTGTLDLRGHLSTVDVGVVNMGRTNQNNTGNANGVLNFDTGTFNATSLNLGIKSNSGTGSNNANAVNIDGGTVTVSGAVAMSAHTGTGATGNVTSKLNISNGTVNLGSTVSVANKNGSGGGVAAGEINVSGGALNVTGLLTLATQATSGTATGLLNITGGMVTLNSDVVDGGGSSTSTVLLGGGTLDMAGNDIGDLANPIILTAESGTLSNVASINGTGGLTKTTAGTLVVNGANPYVGDTTVSQGTLTLSSAAGPLNANTGNDGSTVTIAAAGATLNLTYTGTDKVDKLFIGATQIAAGVYGPSATPLAGITGTGTLTVTTGPVGGYSSWQNANGPTSQTINLDHDSDGVSNGIEYFLGGNTNTTGFTALPGVTNTAGILSVTWTKGATYTGTYGTDFWVETSATLTGVWTPAALGAGLDKVDITTVPGDVKYTFPVGTTNFARLKVTGP